MIPQNGQLSANAPPLGDGWEALDSNADKQINLDELFAYVDQQLGPRLRVALETRQQQSARLFGPLDIDGDEHVGSDEIESGLAILHINDFDDDGTLSLAELQPYPTAMRLAIQQQQAEDSGDIPLVTLMTKTERDEARKRLLNFYGAGGAGDADSKSIPCDRIGGISADDVASYDNSADGQLDFEEIAELLDGDAPRLVDRRSDPVQPRPGFRQGHAESCRACDVDHPADAGTGVSSGRHAGPNECFHQQGRRHGGPGRNRELCRRAVSASGRGQEPLSRRNRVHPVAGPVRHAQPAGRRVYAVIDADGDGMLMQNEVKDYARTNSSLAEATLVVTVRDDAATLFDILDGNDDNRLSPREFQEGAIRIKRYDHDRDGRFGMTEMRSEFSLKISRTRPQFLSTTRQNQNPNANVGVPRFTPDTSGPTWFRKMDRNQDGDVAWREFLGPRADFDRIDSDGNALIDLNEAAAVE